MEENEPRTTLRRPSPLPWILVAAAVLALGAWLFLRMRAPSEAPAQEAAAPAPAAEEKEPTAEAAAEGEAKLSTLLPKLSPDPLVQKGVAFADFVRRAAVVVDNLAEGVSPRRELAFLAPAGAFKATEKNGRLVVDPASYARYDAFTAAVVSVDERTLGAAVRAGRPALQAAYRMLGQPGPAFDKALARALKRIADAPVRDGDVALEDQGGVYTYADPKLEKLPQVERHLLRMGPGNTRQLQEKARAIAAELGYAPL